MRRKPTRAYQASAEAWRKKVTTSGIPICKLPKNRLGEVFEFLDEVLDSTLTAAISDLRCERYIDVYLRVRAASNRIKQCNAHDYNEVLSKLKLCHLDPTDVVGIAVTRGFEQHWLERNWDQSRQEQEEEQREYESWEKSRNRPLGPSN